MMAEAKRPLPVKLIMGAIFTSEGILIKAKESLTKKFGPLDFQSQIIPFDFTNYYEKEMGAELLRQFFSFQKLINPQTLPEIKLSTNRLEKRLSLKTAPTRRQMVRQAHHPSNHPERSRRINLDPGYISDSKLVLATCKNYAHRIYLDKGIYAEVTLHFQRGAFRPWPWTYPDYQSQEYLQSFNKIRELYLKQLKQ